MNLASMKGLQVTSSQRRAWRPVSSITGCLHGRVSRPLPMMPWEGTLFYSGSVSWLNIGMMTSALEPSI